jgi:hypothetical protein
MQRGLTYLLIIFGLLLFQISPKFFSFYRAPWFKGWAGHTSSTVESELLLVIEYTTYMIVTCTQSPLMSLLESWNWCFFLSPWMLKIFEEDIWYHLPNRRVASFILSFLAETGSGPTISTCMWVNLCWGTAMCSGRSWTCLYTFPFWQPRQEQAASTTERPIHGQQYSADTRRVVA